MTITASNLTNGALGSASSFTSASISPSGSCLILLSIYSNMSTKTVPNIPTFSGTSNLSWTQVNTIFNENLGERLTLWRAMRSNPNSGTVYGDFSLQTQQDIYWSIDQFNNVKTSGSNGADAIVQSPSSSVSGTQTGISINLNAFSSSNNVPYGVLGYQSIRDASVGSGFSQLSKQSSAMIVEWKNSNTTTVNFTWASISATWNEIAAEIAAPVSTSILKVAGVVQASISKVCGDANASINKVAGVSNVT